jgi:hypothetical protein
MSTSAANVAKYLLGGSGDNIVADGYIKTVEKVWIDSYTIAFTATLATIIIAELPENKKITSIDVEIYTTLTQTSGTISIGYSSSGTDDISPTGVGQFLAPATLKTNETRTSIHLPGNFLLGSGNLTNSTSAVSVLAGFQAVTAGTNVSIAIKLNNWIMTTGTLKTIVRYT